MMEAFDFLSAIAGTAQGSNGSADRPVRLATVDPAYAAASYPGTLPRVTFDGESTLSVRRYASMYAPAPGDRVVMQPVGNTYVISGAINAAGAWQAYTPTWTTFGTAPSLGNGTLTSRWCRLGNTVTYSGRLVIGTTTAFGTGGWIMSLPVPSAAGTSFFGAGAVMCYDLSTIANRIPGVAWHSNSTSIRFNSTGGDITGLAPFAWADADQLRWTFTYEVEVH